MTPIFLQHTPVKLLTVLLLMTGLPAFSQVDVLKYLDQNAMPFLNRPNPIKVDFKWDMDGPSQTNLNDGISNLDEGKWLLALGAFDSFINTNYNLWVGHFYRGQALLHLGRFKEAAYEFRAVTKLNPRAPEGYLELGEALEQLRDRDGAETNYRLAVKADPKFVYGYFKLGNLALSNGLADDALTHYKKCIKLNPKFPDAYLAQGIIAFVKEKKFDEATAYFRSALSADSTFSPANFWCGLSYLQTGKKDLCLTEWKRFILRNPHNTFVLAMRGFLEGELGDYEAAFSDFRKILQSVSVKEDKFQAAQTPLDRRIDLQSGANYLIRKGYGLKEEAFANLKAGFCLLLMNQESKALEYLRKADRMATSPAIYFLLAIGYEHRGVHQGAFEYYNKALQLDNDIFDAHKKRAIYYSEMKVWNLAYKDIDEMLRLQPDAPVAYKVKGLIEATQGLYALAIADFSRYIKSDSTDYEALSQRAFCLSLNGQPAAATPDLQRILSLGTKSESEHDKLYSQFLGIKDTLNAVFVLKNLIDTKPIGQAFAELAKIYIAQRKYDDALAEINRGRTWVESQQEKTFLINGMVASFDVSKISGLLSNLEGIVAYHRADYVSAISSFNRSLNEDASIRESRYLRGKSYAQSGNFRKAATDMKSLQGLNYKDAAELYETYAKQIK